MARVNVEQTALTDRRYQTLGRLYKKDRWWALSRMIAVWNQCQEEEVYHLSDDNLLDIHPDLKGFGDAMIKAELARREDDGSVYICGTKGRIEWIKHKREAGKEHGHKGAAYGVKGGRPKKPPNEGFEKPPHGGSEETPKRGEPRNPPPAPAPAPALRELPPVVTSTEEQAKLALGFLDEKAGGRGNKFSEAQERELLQGLGGLLLEFKPRDIDIAIAETFKSTDPPRTPALILRDIESNALTIVKMRAGGS